MSRPTPPDRVTLPLLTLITQQSLDEDYLHVAERRARAGSGPPRRRRRATVVLIAAFGVLVATAAVQTSQNAGVGDASRTTLVSRITGDRDEVSLLQAEIVRLRQGNVRLEERRRSVTSTAQQATVRLRRLQAHTGFVAVTGEGVRITVDDAPAGEVPILVQPGDLALLTDGLWNAGAEAIAVNDRRLTALTSFTSQGVAISLGASPLTPPYSVQAIGDTRTLQADLLDTTSANLFFRIRDEYGFAFTMQNEDSMTLPAASLRPLRHAVALSPDGRTDEEDGS